MLTRLLQRLTGERQAEAPKTAATETYKGFTIHAAPRKDDDGWRVAGRIERETDAGTQSHEFIRADAFPDQDAAVTVTLRKAQQMIDQLGPRVFDQTR
ncbi:hypothetical protein H0Z60_13250 [Ectothiorhodospiraceae bacterium WFHF3C12]|nr:hypothetical protein [Ectothiorhodospiraceae bacterium WFHF3C12]